jgi:GT2 family glycosyltransferase
MIYAILVNWNGWRDTIECLTSLLAARHDGLTVVVCDNASADDSIARLTAWADGCLSRAPGAAPPPLACRATTWQPCDSQGAVPWRLVLLENVGNYGFAGGNNVGIQLALRDPECRYVFILNNDTVVDADALLALQGKLERNPQMAICGATLVYHDQPGVVQGVGSTYNKFTAQASRLHGDGSVDDLPDEADIDPRIEYVIGAAIFARASLFRRIGGLSEDYFLYYEEMDLSRRLLGHETMGWARDARIAHKVGGSIGTGRTKSRASDLSIYYDHRSKIRYYWNHLRGYTPFLVANLIRGSLVYLRRGDTRAAKVIGLALVDFIGKDKSFRRSFQPRNAV